MCCGNTAPPTEVRDAAGELLPSFVGADGRTYPVFVWVVCPGPDPGYLLGIQANWDAAMSKSIAAGCPFASSMAVLYDVPTVGRWLP